MTQRVTQPIAHNPPEPLEANDGFCHTVFNCLYYLIKDILNYLFCCCIRPSHENHTPRPYTPIIPFDRFEDLKSTSPELTAWLATDGKVNIEERTFMISGEGIHQLRNEDLANASHLIDRHTEQNIGQCKLHLVGLRLRTLMHTNRPNCKFNIQLIYSRINSPQTPPVTFTWKNIDINH